jgi:DNA-binding winged helix-turn-helix (wHTH) protein
VVSRFGPFSLDGDARLLGRGSQPVHLSPKAFDLLALLVARRPAAVSKADIHRCLWPRTFVADVNLAVLIAEIRSALGDDARHPQYVRTVQRFGYAFVTPVTGDAQALPPISSAEMCWLTWGSERAPLSHGDNLLGRDPAAEVRIDAPGVSRRHAIIRITQGEVTLHDLSSKNGTYVDDVRITSPMPLIDGTELRLGPIRVSFRRRAGIASTETMISSRV